MSEPHERRQTHNLADVEVRVNAAVLEALASHKNLSPTEHRIIWCVLFSMDPHTGVAWLTREDIANRVNAGTAFVSRATTKLKGLGLLWRVDNDRVQVNPHFGFRGESREEWEQAVRDLPGDAPAIRFPAAVPAECTSGTRKKPHLRLVR